MFKKAKVLYFNSKHEGKLIEREIVDGAIDIEDKKFIVENAIPILIHTKFGVQPLYLLKWNEIRPSRNVNPTLYAITKLEDGRRKEKKMITTSQGNFTPVVPEWSESYKDNLTPELVKKMMGLKILGNMIKVKRPAPTGLAFLIMGIAIGVAIMFSLISFGLIHF